jgi:hypothetical protein
MTRFQTFFLLALILGGAAVLFYQYGFYRTPLGSVDSIQNFAEGEVRETDGIKHSIDLDLVIVGNPRKDGIPAIDDPSYESVRAADVYLDDNGYGLMVEVGGRNRFYPYQILVWHEIVNDTLGGLDLAVTYCPLCFTGVAYEREIGDVLYDFGVSGKLYDNNLLMYDRQTDSYWSQALGEAVVGEMTGTELVRYGTLSMTWMSFKSEYPSGSVLSRDTGFSRDYTQDPYGPRGYYTSADILFPLSHEDDRLFSKEIVFGYQSDNAQMAFPSDSVKNVGFLQETVGDREILVFWDPNLEAVRGYSRVVGSSALDFEMLEDRLKDTQSGSLWNFDGEAVGGKYLGDELEALILEQAFWFSWVASHPETEVYTKESL